MCQYWTHVQPCVVPHPIYLSIPSKLEPVKFPQGQETSASSRIFVSGQLNVSVRSGVVREPMTVMSGGQTSARRE